VQSQPQVPSIELTGPQLTGLLLGLGLATGMEFYTFDAMNLVLVDLAGTLGVSFDEASWLLTIYSSTLFLGVPVCIWLAGHVGYKRYLIATTLLFAVASLGCMLSPDLNIMLAWRAVQGFAGAGLIVWWRAAIYMILPKAKRSGSMMRVSTMLYLSSATGLLLGGALTDHFTWRLIFLPVIPYAAGAVWLLSRCFPTMPHTMEARLIGADWFGIALLAVSLIALQVALNRGHIDDWLESPYIRSLILMSVCAFIAFLWWQLNERNRVPLLYLDLLRDRRVMAAVLIGICTGMILSGSLYVLPEYLRTETPWRLSAAQTGEVMCIYALSAAAIRPGVVELIARLGQRKTIISAILVLIASMLIFSRLLTTDTPRFYYAFPLVLYAFCLAPLLSAVGSGTVAKVEYNKLLDGVSLYMTFRQFGASLGVALLTHLIESRETLHSSRLFEHLREAGASTASWLVGAAGAVFSRAGLSPQGSAQVAVGLLRETSAHQSATLAYADAFLLMAGVGVVALCLVPIIPPTPPTK
jgi:MFS transporter, DHA2 family, multidrug resistance protein